MKIGLDFPQRYYPRSFLSLLLLAFALVAAPLIVAFYNAAVYVEQLADQSQTAVSQAAQASRGSRLLVEQTTALERVVRQYLILDDAELLNDYGRLRANFKANTSELSLQPLDELQLHELNQTIDKEQELYEQLLGKPATEAGKTALVDGYGALSDLARDVLNTSNALIDREVESLRERLIELEQQKRLFLRHVSHELKTPLTALREGSELLADEAAGPLSAGQREIVGILRENSVRLQQLIEDLLNYHRAEESVGRLELAPLRFERIVEQVLEDHRLAARARGIRVDLRLERVMLHADEEKLRTVVANLVSNAIKYSPDGGIISLALHPEGDKVVLDVEDTGPGIPPEDRERIFDWFYQGEHVHRGRVSGSGLGLAIAREFVAAHGGRIEVVDDLAAGAHFRVTLPRAAAPS